MGYSKKDGKDQDPANRSQYDSTMKPPERPGDMPSSQSLFSQAGPVILQSARRGVLTLGGVASRQPPPMPPTQAMATQAPVAQEMPAAQPMPAAQAPPPQSSPAMDTRQRGSVLSSVSTSWSPTHWTPKIDSTAHVDGRALVIGNVKIGARVYISAGVIIRGQNEEPVCIGDGSYIQENVVIRDLPSRVGGKVDKMRLVEVDGIEYSVYVGKNVAICAQAQIHGPARIEDGAYIGMQCLIFWAGVAQGAVVEPGCLVMNANVPVGVFVPAGLKILSQKSVKDLPPLTPQYRLYGIGAQTTDEGQEYLSGGMH